VKEKEAIVDYGDHQLVMFVEKGDGTYGTIRTGSYMAATYVDDFWEKQRNLEKMCFDKLTSGQFSPVAYYIMLKDMAPADVAVRTGLSARVVKNHMDPKHFGKISLDVARRYAEVFGVALADLFQVPIKNEDGMCIRHKATENPYIVLTACEKDRK
jgi:hypothetical protein